MIMNDRFETVSDEEILSHVRKVIWDNAWEFNNIETRERVRTAIYDFTSRSNHFMVVCDEMNNPPSVIDQNDIIVWVYIRREALWERYECNVDWAQAGETI